MRKRTKRAAFRTSQKGKSLMRKPIRGRKPILIANMRRRAVR